MTTQTSVEASVGVLALVAPTVLGTGDAKFAFLIALALPPLAARAIVLALGPASCTGLVLAVRRRAPLEQATVPFASFVAAAALLPLR